MILLNLQSGTNHKTHPLNPFFFFIIPKRSFMNLISRNELNIRVIATFVQCVLWSELCFKQFVCNHSFSPCNDPQGRHYHFPILQTETLRHWLTYSKRWNQHLNSRMLASELLILATIPYCFLIYTGHLRSRMKIAITISVLSLFHFMSSIWSEKYSFNAKITIHLHTFPLSSWYWKYWKIMNNFTRNTMKSWQLSG